MPLELGDEGVEFKSEQKKTQSKNALFRNRITEPPTEAEIVP